MTNKTIKPKSKAHSANPKDLVGATKVSISKFPAIAIVLGAHAMMQGAKRYGPYNWRAKKVQAHIYIDACYRHAMKWFEGQEIEPDSGCHHLGHAIACLAILLDAQYNGRLIDDRPVRRRKNGKPANPDWLAEAMDEVREKIKAHSK